MEGAAKAGRPRSEQARAAVLYAVDDLLVEVGYAAMTMKGIAERAGVGRQTLYRWWSTKAEILLEAAAFDAVKELTVAPGDLPGYLAALVRFLTVSDAGQAYRALLAAAQQDPAVAELLAGTDVLGSSARAAIGVDDEQAAALVVGPVLYWVLTGREAGALDIAELARSVRSALDSRGGAARPVAR
jgi:AcrR family transcriptional regulator